MLEIKSKVHTNRYFANTTSWLDIFRAVHYFSYRGNLAKVPFFYFRKSSVSCATELTQSMEAIMASMKSNTRNEIRRAVKEGCVFSIEKSVDEFIPFYNDFCASKGLNDFTSKSRIQKYKTVLITKVLHNGIVLARHINVLDENGKLAFLMFSCSQRFSDGVDRKMIGWGNKYLHYKELEHLKSLGYTYYDWSGICLDPEDERYFIGQFKLSFGGTVVKPVMLKTPLFVILEIARTWLMRLRMSLRGKKEEC